MRAKLASSRKFPGSFSIENRKIFNDIYGKEPISWVSYNPFFLGFTPVCKVFAFCFSTILLTEIAVNAIFSL